MEEYKKAGRAAAAEATPQAAQEDADEYDSDMDEA